MSIQTALTEILNKDPGDVRVLSINRVREERAERLTKAEMARAKVLPAMTKANTMWNQPPAERK